MATGIKLPPLPWGKLKFEDPQWQDWFKVLRNYVVTTGVAWDGINFTGSNLSDIESRPHADLQLVLGDGSYHMDLTRHNLVSVSQAGTWVPTASGFTTTGTVITTASYVKFATGVQWWIKISATTITTSGATLSLPFAASQDSVVSTIDSASTGYTTRLSTNISVPNVTGVSYLILTGTYNT